MKTNDAFEEVTGDPSFKRAMERLDDGEREKVDAIVRNFIDNFVSPIDELVRIAKDDPEIMNEVRDLLTKQVVERSESEKPSR